MGNIHWTFYSLLRARIYVRLAKDSTSYLGGALSAMTTIMWTGIVLESGGLPQSVALTISMYSVIEPISSSLAMFSVPSSGSRLKAFPTFPKK